MPLRDELQKICAEQHKRMVAKGFWEKPPEEESPLERQGRLMLLVGEVAEVSEALRGGERRLSEKIPPFCKEEEEAADIFLRLADICGAYDLNLGGAVEAKLTHNTKRPPKHGKTC